MLHRALYVFVFNDVSVFASTDVVYQTVAEHLSVCSPAY